MFVVVVVVFFVSMVVGESQHLHSPFTGGAWKQPYRRSKRPKENQQQRPDE